MRAASGDRGDRRGAVVAHLIEREDQLVGDDLRPVDDRNGLPVFGFIFPEFVFRKITVFVEPDRGVSFLRARVGHFGHVALFDQSDQADPSVSSASGSGVI